MTSAITLEDVNENVLALKQEVDEIKSLLEESEFELSEEAKVQMKESRGRPISQFKTQADMEKKFL